MSNKPTLSNLPTYKAGMWQSQAYRALSNFMTGQLKKFHLSVPEWMLLGHLSESETMTPSDISRILNIKLPISTRLLNSLEEKDFLSREQDKADNRVVYASITSKGSRLVAAIEGQLRSELKLYLSDIDTNEFNTYLEVMHRLARKLP